MTKANPESSEAGSSDAVSVAVDPDRLLRGIAEASRLLVDLEDAYTAIMPRCLAAVGEALEVDRVYIFEIHRGGDGAPVCSQRFEWSQGSVAAQIDNPELQEVPFSLLGDWERVLRRGEPLAFIVADYANQAIRELLEAQDIISILVVPINLGGQLWGFVGFDDCTRRRVWREAEVLALTALSAAFGGAMVRTRIHQTMLDLSTPILQVWDGVLAVPLVGRLTSERADRLIEELLAAISTRGASELLLDITGMSAIATSEVERLLRAVRAARLLGACCTLVGTSPAVAQALVGAGVDLSGVKTRARLQDGLAEILAKRRLPTPNPD